jgi:pantoate--beta-alanine ligase
MVRELDVPVDIVVAPTVRESDGLAMSSRNSYLSATDRRDALALVESLRAAAAAFAGGEWSGAALAARGRAVLDSYPGVRPDYFAVVDPDEMRPVERASLDSVAIVAARVGQTRLIDNIVLGEGA